MFIGESLGVTGSASAVRALMAALCFHQANEGVALGALAVGARFSR